MRRERQQRDPLRVRRVVLRRQQLADRRLERDFLAQDHVREQRGGERFRDRSDLVDRVAGGRRAVGKRLASEVGELRPAAGDPRDRHRGPLRRARCVCEVRADGVRLGDRGERESDDNGADPHRPAATAP